jgi:heptosyltransferase-2
VGIAPGAAFGHAKRWSPTRYAQLVSLLIDAGVTCVIIGRSEDRDAARDIKGIDLIGQTDLAMLMGVLSHCSVVVANDSGALHLAAGLGVPVVGIWGPTDERYSTPVTPYEDSHTVAVMSESVFCRPCFLADCPIDHRCMKRIPTERVHDAVRRFLEESHA